MGAVFNERVIVHPSFIEPDFIITIAQASGFMSGLASGSLRVRLDPSSKYVYVPHLDVRTAVAAQQASANLLPSASLTADYVQTATYRVRTRNEYSEIDEEEAGTWNVSLPAAYRLAARQGIFQFIRSANLYGVNASNHEGLLNTVGATAVNLPADPNGNTTLTTYDAGALALFWLAQLNALLTRMNQLGLSQRIVIIGPQRVIGWMELVDIIQLTSYQRAGAGSATTAQTIKEVFEAFGYELEYAVDDTLIGKGANGNDAILILAPEVIVPEVPGINTNEFAKLQPNMDANIVQYADMAAPMETTTPIPEGLDVVSQMRITSGWVLRPEAITIVSAQYQ